MVYVFETERLKLRRLEPEDAENLYRIHLDEDVKHWFPNESYADVEEAREAIAFFAGCVDRKELPYVLAVEEKATGELIGDTGLSEVEGKPGEAEIGYVIRRANRGRGYAAELARAMGAFAHTAFQIKVMYGRVVKGNAASARVLEKAGYRFAAEEHGAEDDPYGSGMLVYVKETV
ncbi:MAG: GNAT family N-acetyltransferase [Clostridia bacterium]|nr:GNAT family N-acetyltransferase [Clostridia bacterium]